MQAIRDAGISHIKFVAPPEEAVLQAWGKMGGTHKVARWSDLHGADFYRAILDSAQRVADACGGSKGVLVSCEKGEHRSVLLGYGAMQASGVSKDKAMEEIGKHTGISDNIAADIRCLEMYGKRAGWK